MKPKIGITPQYNQYTGNVEISPFYAQAIEDMGGIPMILPYALNQSVTEEYANSLDGILFAGGNDINPKLYGDNISADCGKIEFERDEFEMSLCKFAEDKNLPVLGICRGCQLICVSAGGTLDQKIDGHFQPADKHMASHRIKVENPSLLYDILGAESMDVNSFHRQNINNQGKLKVCAKSESGSIEGVYNMSQKFHLGIQWHPERMYRTNAHARLIFEAFITACM